jgi:hypothetical protein
VIKSKRIKWGGGSAQKNCIKCLVGRPDGKRPAGKPRPRWEDNIKMDFKEIGWKGMDWIDLAEDREKWRELLNVVMNLGVP